MNRTTCTSRKITPFEILYGHNSRLIRDPAIKVPGEIETLNTVNVRCTAMREQARYNLVQAKINQSIQTNRKRRSAEVYQVGDLVLLSTRNLLLATAYKKTAQERIGPLPVIEALHETVTNQTPTLSETLLVLLVVQLALSLQ